MTPSRLLVVPLAVVLVAAGPGHPNRRFDPEAVAYFEKKVRPLLVNNCNSCHSATTNSKGGLRVDDRNGLIQGGGRGPAVIPGDPENSILIQAVVQAEDDLKMPPKKRLTAEEIAVLTKWIKDGAAWTEVDATVVSGNPMSRYEKLRKEHWAWQPLKKTVPPAVGDVSWPRSEIDRFVLARLENAGLKPVRDADRRTLIRRVTFDLTGLPPTPAEIDAFLADGSPQALDQVVDRLLAGSGFGQQWARHWLDVARYGESTGSSRNLPMPHAWRYRDYVIDAFAHDKAYNLFIQEQIAGDLLPAGAERERDEKQIATGFLAIGVKDVNQRFKVRFIMDNVDEQIDAVSRAFLATTASCARCHDHKFDPISTADYYALAGIFRSTDLCAGLRNKMGGGGLDYYDPTMLVALGEGAKPDADRAAKVAAATKALEAAKREFEAIRGTPKGLAKGPDGLPTQRPFRLKMVKLESELLALTDPANGKVAFGARDAKTVGDTEIRVRGEAEKLGPVVPRGFLSVPSVPDVSKINPRQSGRLELAQWLTSLKNPLTPRVIVNRVWQHLFAKGLVQSVDNFGVTGDTPSHPELLDFLAERFVAEGWSIKKLVRHIVSSRAYALAPDVSPTNLEKDPDNRLIWRHSPRRKSAEEIRDSMLAAAGTLDLARPEASPAKDLKVIEMANNGLLARRIVAQASKSRYRSIYLPLLRGLTPTSLEVFDFAEQGMVSGSRDTTTVPVQALYLLNDPFVRRQSLFLAERLLERTGSSALDPIDQAYRLTLGRPASGSEIQRAKTYLAKYESTVRAVVALAPPAPAERPSNVLAAADAESTAKTAPKRPAPPVNPDEVEQVETPVAEEAIVAADPRVAAWASFCQALLGSAEFRYVP
jgi:Protein of unknown function (DUF1553)/Protein of unknown function (DUF1549)/Planctomycete cytochrome C